MNVTLIMRRRHLGYTSTPKRDYSKENSTSLSSKNINSNQVERSNKRLIEGDVSSNTVQMCIKKKIQCCENINSSINKKLKSANCSIFTNIDVNNLENVFPKMSDVKENNSSLSNLLSIDESFLEEIDFDSVEKSMLNKEKNKDKDKGTVSENVLAFSEPGSDDDDDDRAWDMSVSLDTDKSLNMTSAAVDNKSPMPAEVQNSPKLLLQDKIRKSLQSNAQKPVEFSNISSPKERTENLSDSYFGLPVEFRRLLKKYKGITYLYEWQEECLSLPAISERRNLVYALPTSGGKTLVAEILILKELLCREKNTLFILPYVSIAQEKVRSLSPFAVELGFVVEEYAGSKGQYPPKKRRRKRTVFVATIEKGLGLVHSLIELNRLDELGLIVVDELHLIGEPNRGENLESVLSKVIFLSKDIQIVGMSATIGNLSEIAAFLHAETYSHNFRPVELMEYVKIEDEVFVINQSEAQPLQFHSNKKFHYSSELQQLDPDQIGGLVAEVLPENSCLVFCPSKKNCENVAVLVCQALDKSLLTYKVEEKKSLLRAIKTEGNGSICSVLNKTIPYGVAYHHSGLTTAERTLLEEAFLAKTISCICCTSTLAAGVNLPARRVILRSPYIGKDLITLGRYKQMIGRAGRAGMGETGEAFLLCKRGDTQKVGELLASKMECCQSQLINNDGIYGLVLSAVALSVTTTKQQLIQLAQCTLLSIQASQLAVDIQTKVEDVLNELIVTGAVVQKNSEDLQLSPIGRAAVKGNFDMGTAKELYDDLKCAQQSLVLVSHLHLLYLCTPYSMLEQIKLMSEILFNTYMELGPKEMQTARVIGVNDQCIAQLMRGRPVKSVPQKVLHRFYLSLMLHDLWNQRSVWEVATKYNVTRGLVHSFLSSAAAFAFRLVRFCEELDEMWCFMQLIGDISNRLTHCCTAELLPLMELPAVKFGRAKQLYNAGYKDLTLVASENPNTLALKIDHLPRKVAHQIVAAAKVLSMLLPRSMTNTFSSSNLSTSSVLTNETYGQLLLIAKAESLQEEAEDVLQGLLNK